MSQSTILKQKIIEFAATRIDSSVFDPKEGYYPFEIIAEAYEKGAKDAEKGLQEGLRKKFFTTAKEVATSINKMLKVLAQNKYTPSKVFAKISLENSKILFTVDEKEYITDGFLDLAYSQVTKIQTELHDRDQDIQLSFLADNIDTELLKSDGFGIAIDIKNGVTNIY